MQLHPIFNQYKKIKLLGYSIGNADYQKAKEALEKGMPALNEDEQRIWIKQGGWLGVVVAVGLIIIDIDNKKKGQVVYEGLLRASYSFIAIETPRGYQFIFQDIGRVKNQSSKRLTLGGIVVDYRLSGRGYIVLPSINTKDRKVIHNPDTELDSMPLFFLPVRGFKETDEELDKIHDGSRTSTFISHASKIREWNVAHGLKLTIEEKRKVLDEINSILCYPPLTDEEIDTIFKSSESYPVISTPKEEGNKKDTLSQADKLVKIASNYKLFHDDNKEGYAFINNECIKVRSASFKQILAKGLWQGEGKAPNTDALNQALNVIEAQAIFDSECIKLYNRVAEFEGCFYYDLCNGNAVKITKKGWDIVQNYPILFKRYSHQQKQVEPQRGGNIQRLFNFLNVREEKNKILSLVYPISCLVPDIPHPIFHPWGDQGSGKTTQFVVYKKLLDPSKLNVIITPRDYNELVQILEHHYLCLFDNLSSFPSWLSNLLSQACTGGGFSKRKLYTDDEDIIYQIMRCIGLNGINLLISRPDLMDRTILLHLERIEPEKRKEWKVLMQDFEEERSYLLGGLFDVLSKAMSIHPSIKLSNLPRMADFMNWGVAIAKALGNKEDEFIMAYQANIESQNAEIINSSTLAQAILTFMVDKDRWEGTVQEAYKGLIDLITVTKEDSTFPKHPNKLRKHLERIKPNLLDYGIKFVIADFNTRKGVPVSFQRIGKVSSQCSLSSKANSINELQGEDTVKILEDGEDTLKVCSRYNPLINKDFKDGEDGEDKIPILEGEI